MFMFAHSNQQTLASPACPAWNKEKQTQLNVLKEQHQKYINHLHTITYPQLQKLIPDLTEEQFEALLDNASTIIKILNPHSTIHNI